MKIKIVQDAECGAVVIPAGDYWVSLRHETREMVLIGMGKDLLIPCTRRSIRARSKTTQINFFSGGGNIWSLVALTPKYGEWVSFIEYKRTSEREREIKAA